MEASEGTPEEQVGSGEDEVAPSAPPAETETEKTVEKTETETERETTTPAEGSDDSEE